MVAGHYSYVVLAHFAGQVRQYYMAVLVVEFNSKHGIGQRFFDNALNFDSFFFLHRVSLSVRGFFRKGHPEIWAHFGGAVPRQNQAIRYNERGTPRSFRFYPLRG
jgi:hypothetical protein